MRCHQLLQIVNNVVMILDSVDDWPPNVVEQESNEYVTALEIITTNKLFFLFAELLKHLTTLLML